ncbi:hypothetical protein DERP_009064 [Dermatophagoides pteronyssinus]|uniref:Uncharacterized protein n=1 Tax=Dermatophagoides pteronyssinus TaxID=6956 RepID=A0ABQ8JGD0_DERPT|nr:hypothetical protein DERP_009064 [Dermatophagoides pteronyssinus]
MAFIGGNHNNAGGGFAVGTVNDGNIFDIFVAINPGHCGYCSYNSERIDSTKPIPSVPPVIIDQPFDFVDDADVVDDDVDN